jgi:hypothetical protein
MADSPVLRAISPDASPEELAAITAAIEVVRHERTPQQGRRGRPPAATPASRRLVRASRLTARRAGLLRGRGASRDAWPPRPGLTRFPVTVVHDAELMTVGLDEAVVTFRRR